MQFPKEQVTVTFFENGDSTDKKLTISLKNQDFQWLSKLK